jgi:hypothetical protein
LQRDTKFFARPILININTSKNLFINIKSTKNFYSTIEIPLQKIIKPIAKNVKNYCKKFRTFCKKINNHCSTIAKRSERYAIIYAELDVTKKLDRQKKLKK